MFGIDGYEPQWHHEAKVLAAAHRNRFARVVGRPLDGAWLMWDVAARTWHTHGPVILCFGDINVEVCHRKFDECAVTWNQIDMAVPPRWPGLTLGWRGAAHPALHRARGRTLRQVNIIERFTVARWRPRVLHAVEFLFDGSRLAIYNALDENGLTDTEEVDLPIGFWRRVSVG